MPTIMSHAIIPITAALVAGRASVPLPVMIAGITLAMLPDADVIGFKLGIAYADALGHRGASHSILAAFVVGGLVVMALAPAKRLLAFIYLSLAMASHGLLDTLTNGGLGAALLWPFSNERWHAAFTPIEVSPIGRAFFSERGLAVLYSEGLWIWSPCALIALSFVGVRRILR